MLTINALTVGYLKDQPILDGLELVLAEGDRLAVGGENGAGKTTLVRALAGEKVWSSGSVLLKGNELTAMPAWKRQELGLGFYMQGAEVFGRLSCTENLRIAGSSMPQTGYHETWKWLKARLPIFSQGAFANKAGNLSGGERAQLALAMVLISLPKIIVLDEPSAGLSGANAEALRLTIADYMHQFGKGLLLIEQNKSLTEALCNRHARIAGKKLELSTTF
ncbi:MAG: ATP-binding cassette domain-containing protein [Bacteroidales bacterium]|nr:ATP-binding cassette domain-containing protein [Bacteroidales bacterium]